MTGRIICQGSFPTTTRARFSISRRSTARRPFLLIARGLLSAAATAGIVAGDRIVAIDGKSAADFSRADLLGIVTQAAGTVISLRVLHSGTTRDVTLTLR